MSIQTIKNHIDKVKSMQYSSQYDGTSDFDSLVQSKPIFDEAEAEIKKNWESEDLTTQGKARREREIKAEYAEKVTKFVESFESIKQKELSAAEKAAKAIISKKTDEPDDFEASEWTKRYNELKMDAQIYGTQASAQAIIKLIRETTDSYYASIILGEFAELHALISDHIDGLSLQDVYTSLKQAAATDEKTTARELLQEIEKMKGQPAVNSMIGMRIDKVLGSEYRHILK